MKATDFRDATFEGLRGSLTGRRRAVYLAWVNHGPGTTRELAERSGIDLLNVRPRTTELCEVGLVRCVAGANGEGIYGAVTSAEWEGFRAERVEGQLQLI